MEDAEQHDKKMGLTMGKQFEEGVDIGKWTKLIVKVRRQCRRLGIYTRLSKRLFSVLTPDSIRGCVLPSVSPSVCPSVRPSVHPSVGP